MKVALRESADAAEAAQALMRDFFETAAAEAGKTFAPLGTQLGHGEAPFETELIFQSEVRYSRLLPGPREEFGKFLPESLNPSEGPKTSREGFARRGRNTGGIEISRPLILPSRVPAIIGCKAPIVDFYSSHQTR